MCVCDSAIIGSRPRQGIEKRVSIPSEKWLTSGVIGLLTGPHLLTMSETENLAEKGDCDGTRGKTQGFTYQISFSDDSSLTIRLSNGDRPVFLPEYAVRAPLEVIAVPVS